MGQAPSYSRLAPEGKVAIVGPQQRSIAVLIRSIDDGPVLWVDGYHLADFAFVDPGTHEVRAVCLQSFAMGQRLVHVVVPIDASLGKVYSIAPKKIDQKIGRCMVKVEIHDDA